MSHNQEATRAYMEKKQKIVHLGKAAGVLQKSLDGKAASYRARLEKAVAPITAQMAKLGQQKQVAEEKYQRLFEQDNRAELTKLRSLQQRMANLTNQCTEISAAAIEGRDADPAVVTDGPDAAETDAAADELCATAAAAEPTDTKPIEETTPPPAAPENAQIAQ